MPAPARPGYLVLEHRGLPLLAFPAGRPEMVGPALGCLSTFSWRRRLYRRAVLARYRLPGPVRRLSPARDAVPFLPGFPLVDFASELVGGGREELFPVVGFPSDLGRKRFYVTLLSPEGAPRTFVKALAGNPTLAPWQGELAARAAFPPAAERPFVLPRIERSGYAQGVHFLAMEPLPRGARPLGGVSTALERRLHAALRAGPSRHERIDRLPWWPGFLAGADRVPALRDELAASAERSVAVGPAHGDFQRANLYTLGAACWLVDWEDYCPAAPVLLDELRFFLGDHTRALVRDPGRILARAIVRLGAGGDQERRLQLALSLAYLCSRDNGSGILCGSQWERAAARV